MLLFHAGRPFHGRGDANLAAVSKKASYPGGVALSTGSCVVNLCIDVGVGVRCTSLDTTFFFVFLEFWMRRATAFTAPLVQFKNKVYVEVLQKDAITGAVDNQAFAASTLKPVNEYVQY